MRVEFEYVTVYEALDDREWGASWGYFTEEEEARAEVKKRQTQWTCGRVEKRIEKVLKK